MHKHLNEAERGLIKIINHFRKRAQALIESGKLGNEHSEVIVACQKLIQRLNDHAAVREAIFKQREHLRGIVKDNAQCHKCQKNDLLKHVGNEKNEKGLKSNRYKCRRCNIAFTWNRPNNPWDLLHFIEDYLKVIDAQLLMEKDAILQSQALNAKQQLVETYEKLKPVIETSDAEFAEFETQEAEINKMIKEFKSFLLIEKVKMDSMDD